MIDKSMAMREQVNDDAGSFLASYCRKTLSAMPKYALLRDAILASIEAGIWRAGSKLPSEHHLAKMTMLSLGTVQHALRTLVDHGAIVRVPGAGTFVAEPRLEPDDFFHCRFQNDAGDGFLPVYSKVLSRSRVGETGRWSGLLDQHECNILCIDRRLDVDGELAIFSRFYVNAEQHPCFQAGSAANLNGKNFKSLLASQSGTPITDLEQRMAFAKTPEPIRQAMKWRSRQGPVLKIVGYSGRRNPAYYMELYLPATDRELVLSS